MQYERIPIDAKDPAGADLAASGWLRAAGADPARYPAAEPATAAWIGSRSTLEALGVERESEVSLDRVASIIETGMRQARSAEEQERAEPAGQPAHPPSPELGLPALAWSPPRSVSELRLAAEPERRTAVDGVLLTGAEETVDELRRSTPLLERRLPDGAAAHEPAHGIAALAIVNGAAGRDPDKQRELTVHTLIVAVEDADGKILAPHTPSEIGHEVDHDAYAAGQWTLAWGLSKLGYTVDRSERAHELFDVQGSWQQLRTPPRPPPSTHELLGNDESVARWTTERASAAWIGSPSARQRLGLDLPVNELLNDPNTIHIAEAELRRRHEAAQERMWKAQEDELVRRGRDRDGPVVVRPIRTLEDFVERRARELAAQGEPSRRIANTPSEASHRAAESSRIEPGDVTVPDPFDAIEVIGEQRRQLYTTQMQPLADGLQRMPSSWVARRHAQLGPPEAHVHRRAARLTRLIESRVEVAEQELGEAQETGTAFDRRGLERKLADLRHQVKELREDGLHLDQKLDPDRLIRSAAYAKEHTLRQAREAARQPEPAREDTDRYPPQRDALDRVTTGLPAPQPAEPDQRESLARSALGRYQAGMPPPNEGEREAHQAWSELDADDLQSATEERLLPDQEYERYDGPLDWNAWLTERNRGQELQRFGIAHPELPAPFVAALGHERAERLARMVEDARLEHAYRPETREELTAQAGELEAAGETLNLELSERVVALEQERDEDREAVRDTDEREDGLSHAAELAEGPERDRLHEDAAAERAHAELLRDGLRTLTNELAELSSRDDHPNRWLDGEGQRFAQALAARLDLEQERTIADNATEQVSELADSREPSHDIPECTSGQPPRETPDAGVDPF